MKPTMCQIQDREAGNVIECGLTLEDATKLVAEYEQEDKDNNIYVAEFYEIVEMGC